ncbi:hypothetical protein D3C72_1462580 [compost metagenome]
MATRQRGQAIRFVGPRILARADTDQGRFQQPYQRGHHLVLRQPARPHVERHPAPDARQRLPEGKQVLIFARITQRGPSRVIPVLLATAGIAAGGLKMAVGQGADPDGFIRGRYCKLVDAFNFRIVGNAFAIRFEVMKGAAVDPYPAIPRQSVVHIDQRGVNGARRRVGMRGAGVHAVSGNRRAQRKQAPCLTPLAAS